LDLQTLIERTGLPPRTLRYVLDHDVVPNLRISLAVHEAGRPRIFGDDFGVAVACAAILLEAGLKRRAVQQLLTQMAGANWPDGKLILPGILMGRNAVLVEFGDGANLRFRFEEDKTTHWFPAKSRTKLPKDYFPRAIVQLDLGRIRDLVLARSNLS
jgi:hypothetical protein